MSSSLLVWWLCVWRAIKFTDVLFLVTMITVMIMMMMITMTTTTMMIISHVVTEAHSSSMGSPVVSADYSSTLDGSCEI